MDFLESTIFNFNNSDTPLAEKLRPLTIDEFVGQEEVIGKDSLLRNMIESKNLSSFILWGPPGVGKTTIAKIISNSTDTFFKSLSAVLASIKEAKAIMEEAKNKLEMTGKKTVLFIDEIHRFNKAQQDAFLSYVEHGTIILIGATTENPSFSIISPLLSRMRVIKLSRLNDTEIEKIIDRALMFLKEKEGINIEIDQENIERIIKISSGDARRCYGILEMALRFKKNQKNIILKKDLLEKILQGRLPSYDKKGDYHFDYISALHKSMRNSDVDAALYYTVKMLESGEDPLYIMRRVIRFSSEDIGLADPNALMISIAARETLMAIGMPEAVLSILQSVAYNSLAPKSNSLYEAYNTIKQDVNDNPDLEVPLQIRNAPTKLMKDEGYGEDYMYAHNYEIPITAMQCLPDILKDRKYYKPKDFGFEKKLKERLNKINELKKKLQ